MKNITVTLCLLLLFTSCRRSSSVNSEQPTDSIGRTGQNQARQEVPATTVQKVEPDDVFNQINLDPIELSEFPLNWTRLTETDSAKIIYSTCDGGNMLITIDPLDSTILFHGQQEDISYKVERFGISVDSVIHFIINESKDKGKFTFTWMESSPEQGRWDLNNFFYGDGPHIELFVSEADKENFISVKQPCRECWDDEFCNEIESRDY